MNWRYRGFTADVKSGTPVIRSVPERVGRAMIGFRWSVDIAFQLQAASSTALEAEIQSFVEQCSVDGGDWDWLYPNGTRSIHSVQSVSFVGGLKVLRAPSFDRPQPGEMSTYRNASVSFGGLIPSGVITAGMILQLDESIQLDNPSAKPARMLVPLQTKPAVWVRPRPNGIARAVQSGTVVCYSRYPAANTIPPPRWPDNHMPQDGGDVRNHPAPVRIDGVPAAFRIDYSYNFAFPAGISGNLFPRTPI